MTAIDGQPGDGRLGYGGSWDGSFFVSLSPGAHTLLLNYHLAALMWGIGPLDHDRIFNVKTRAGHVYLLALPSIRGAVPNFSAIDVTAQPARYTHSLPLFPLGVYGRVWQR